MARLFTGLLILGCLGAGATLGRAQGVAAQAPQPRPASVRPPADPNKFALIISGAGGEETYTKQFSRWTMGLRTVLTERLGFGAEQVRVLAEQPGENVSARSTAEEVRKAFESMAASAGSESTVFVFLIGHGTFDGKEAKFNLVGPDLPAAAYAGLLGAIHARRTVVFNMASASGEFIKTLAGKGRVLVTATRSGQEQNATRFAEHFIAALTDRDADTDQNGRVSVLEAFNYASALVASNFSRAGRLATEHPLLEDNGDGVGHPTAEGGDGALARVTYLDSLTLQQAAANVATARLLKEQERLVEEVEQLKTRKTELPEAQYETTLEKLLIELAKVSRDIRKGVQ